jgi:tetratricopeptide (TPR) repeat protein
VVASVTGHVSGLNDMTLAPPTIPPASTPDPAHDASEATFLPDTPPSTAPQSHVHGPLTPGTSFGSRYRVIRLLGIGGMGAVYQAWDDELGEAVALKVIRPEATEDAEAARGLERRFKRELVLARQVTHKNVVRIHDLGEISGVKYLTMPYVQGTDLAAFLRKEGKVPLARAITIAKQIAAGLQAAHEAGVVHRDLKPANVMLDADDRAIIMDFGIARSISGAAGGATVAGAVVGTLEYMAPEQAMAHPTDHRADIYAFGLILYDMLVGRRSSSRAESAVAALMERIQRPLPPVRSIDPTIPEPLDALVSRCVQPDPANRFQTTAELVAALDALDATGQAVGTTPSGTQQRLPTAVTAPLAASKTVTPAVTSWRTWFAAAAAVTLVAIAVVVAVWLRGGPTQPRSEASAAPATSLAIVPFRNATGDATLDWIGASLASMMKEAVGDGSAIRAVPSERVFQILSDLRVSTEVEPDEGTVRRLAEFSAAEHVLTGKYVRLGSRLRLEATLRTIKTAGLSELSAETDQADLTRAVTQLSGAVRRHLAGTAVASGPAQSVAPSTRSVDALRAFTEGVELRRRAKHLDALKRFEQAVTADAGFALAYAKLGEAYASLGQDTDAERASREAVQRAEQLPPREKYEVLAAHARITNDHEKAIEAYASLAKLAPGDSLVLFDMANAYEATGDYDRAHRTLLDVLKLDPQFSNALFAIGRVEIRRGNPEGALEHLNRALSLAIQADNTELKGTLLNAIGIAYKRLGKPEDAARYYNEALEIRRRIGDKRGIAGSLNELGQVHAQLKRQREALTSFEESLKIRRELNDRRGTGNVLLDLGNLYGDRGEYEPALKLFKESLQIWLEVGDEDSQGQCLNNIGDIYRLQTRYDEALTYFERALHIWEQLKLPAFVADGLHNIGETLTHMGQYDKALTQYLRALELRRGSNDRRGSAIESFSMGAIFEQQGRYAAALDAREEGVKAFRELNDSQWLAEMLIGYGNTLVLIGRADQARKVLDEALTLARDLGSARLTGLALNARGNSHFYRGEFKEARQWFEQARRAIEKSPNSDVELEIRLNLAKVDVKEGRARTAVSALKAVARRSEELRLRGTAAECSLYLGEALLASGNVTAARAELQAALNRADTLGVRPLTARSHYLLASVFKRIGDQAAATRHVEQAGQIVEALRKEARTDDLLARDDLRPIARGIAPSL